MTPTVAEVEQLTERIIGYAVEVHRTLGPGLLESVYRECMIIEIRRDHLRVESERHVPLLYKGQRINGELKLDLLVEGCVIVELKAVERIHPCPSRAGDHLSEAHRMSGRPPYELQFDSSQSWPKTTTSPGPVREENLLIF